MPTDRPLAARLSNALLTPEQRRQRAVRGVISPEHAVLRQRISVAQRMLNKAIRYGDVDAVHRWSAQKRERRRELREWDEKWRKARGMPSSAPVKAGVRPKEYVPR